jgi:3-oxoacyl-[acyl-carrier-protein] synthase II
MSSPEIAEDYRIVITGVGGKTPVGDATEYRFDPDVPTAWENTLDGVSGITTIDQTPMNNYPGYEKILPLKLGASVKEDVDNHPFIKENYRHHSKYWSRAGTLAALAMWQAMESAKVDLESLDRWRIGHFIASVFGGNGYTHRVDLTKEKLFPYDGTRALFGQVGLGPASFFELNGKGRMLDVECAGSLAATEDGIGALLPQQFGRELLPPLADMVIVGGTDGTFEPEPAANFVKSFRLAPDLVTDDPRQAPRPFDKHTKGFVIGDGAVVMVLEPWHKAQERGLKEEDVLAEVVGFNSLTHARNVTLAGIEGQVRTMQSALKMRKLALDGLRGYLRAHGTGTLLGDAREALAFRETLRRLDLDPNDWFINSTMGAHGHIMGGAGIFGLYYAVMSVKYGETPRPQKITDPIPELTDPSSDLIYQGKGNEDLAELVKQDLPQIPEENVTSSTKPDIAVANAFGFSGGGTTIAVMPFKA